MNNDIVHSLLPKLHDTVFTRCTQHFSYERSKKQTTLPFKDHPQHILLSDILSRKESHHLLLRSNFSSSWYKLFFDAFLYHLHDDAIPQHLRAAELFLFDNEFLNTSINYQHDFKLLLEALDEISHIVILALPLTFFINHKQSDLFNQLQVLMHHPKCRMIALSPIYSKHSLASFSTITLATPTDADIAAILRRERTELELFHQIIIPDELLAAAYALAERYLSTQQTLEKTLELLDSAAARTSVEKDSTQSKPVLSLTMLISVLSSWTQIPSTHLQSHKFKLVDFSHNMQQRIFGQDAALNIISHEIQQSQAQLQQRSGPFCSFIFAGATHTGKKTTAIALAEQLFKQLNLFYSIKLTNNHTNLLSLKFVRCTDKQQFNLADILEQTPYAIFLFELIENASATMVSTLQDILQTGIWYDEEGTAYNFRQAIIIMTTTIGSQHLSSLAEHVVEEESEPVDLMQLIMNEQKQQPTTHYSAHEIIDEIRHDVSIQFPTIFPCARLVPFLPLNKTAIEKILRLKLKTLGKMLDARHGIELSYAPEVLRYLSQQIGSTSIDNRLDADQALKQLYFVVEQAVLNQIDNKHRGTQLFLQLNETGQLLRCDWLAATAMSS